MLFMGNSEVESECEYTISSNQLKVVSESYELCQKSDTSGYKTRPIFCGYSFLSYSINILSKLEIGIRAQYYLQHYQTSQKDFQQLQKNPLT